MSRLRHNDIDEHSIGSEIVPLESCVDYRRAPRAKWLGVPEAKSCRVHYKHEEDSKRPPTVAIHAPISDADGERHLAFRQPTLVANATASAAASLLE